MILFCSITFFLGLLGWEAVPAAAAGAGAALLVDWPRWVTGLLRNWGGLALLTVLAYLVWPGTAPGLARAPAVPAAHQMPPAATASSPCSTGWPPPPCSMCCCHRAACPIRCCSVPSCLQPARGAGPCAGGIRVFGRAGACLLTHYLPVDKLLASCLSTRCALLLPAFLCALPVRGWGCCNSRPACRLQGVMMATHLCPPW